MNHNCSCIELDAKQLLEAMPNIKTYDKHSSSMLEKYVLASEVIYTPTEIGRQLKTPLSAKKTNVILEQMGLQFKQDKEWKLTPKGSEFGVYSLSKYLLKESSEGKVYVIFYVVKWRKTILNEVNKFIEKEEKAEVA